MIYFIADTPNQNIRIVLKCFCKQTNFLAKFVFVSFVEVGFPVLSQTDALHDVHVADFSHLNVPFDRLYSASPGTKSICAMLRGQIDFVGTTNAFDVSFYTIYI
jgi:hypothetical protein